MRKYRTLDEIEEEYLRKHPDEFEDYIQTIFEEYIEDGDTGSLLSSLRIVALVYGKATTAKAVEMTMKGLQEALSRLNNPEFNNVDYIMSALADRMMSQKIETAETDYESRLEAEQEKLSSFG
jgi:HTH-type transcriptional regulator/antitoxin HigA